MKKILLLSLGIMLGVQAGAQLQNLDFEEWDFPLHDPLSEYNRPTGWINCNRWWGLDEAAFSEKFVNPVDSNAANNDYALRLFTYYNYMKDAAVQTAAIDYRPTTLHGLYKYEDNLLTPLGTTGTLADTAQITATLTKWNSVLGKNETIGYGKFSTYNTVNTFTPFDVDIVYTSAEQPDSITIYLDPSVLGRYTSLDIQNAAEGGISAFTVDNLTLSSGTTDISNISKNKSIALHPNPAKDFIHFEKTTGDAIIADQTGRIIISFKLQEQQSADISQLAPGAYMLQITNSSAVSTSKFIKW